MPSSVHALLFFVLTLTTLAFESTYLRIRWVKTARVVHAEFPQVLVISTFGLRFSLRRVSLLVSAAFQRCSMRLPGSVVSRGGNREGIQRDSDASSSRRKEHGSS